MITNNIKEDLSAIFRWAARLNMHESVVNHFSVCESENSNNFYVNKCGIHFSRIKTSDLILVTPDNVLELKRVEWVEVEKISKSDDKSQASIR